MAFLGDQFSIFYAMLAVGVFLCSVYVAFSKYGQIVLGGEDSEVEYSNFKWGVMIFTSTMAADIVFYAMIEWALYAQESYLGELGSVQKWASTFPLFHWGPIAWSFYIMLAVAFGFMLHNRKVEKQKFSEACRPLLGDKVDGWMGKNHRLDCHLRVNRGYCYNILASNTASFSGDEPSVWGFKIRRLSQL